MASVTVTVTVELEVECSNADAKRAEEGEEVSEKLTALLAKIEDALANGVAEVGDVNELIRTDSEITGGNPDD